MQKTSLESSTKNPTRPDVAPAASFAKLLETFSKHEEGADIDWARTPLPEGYFEDKPTIIFQNIDIRESGKECSTPEIHLFGVTSAGYSVLARFSDFHYYVYYPVPVGFVEQDLGGLLKYLNETIPSSTSSSPVVRAIELEQRGAVEQKCFLKISVFHHKQLDSVKSFFALGKRCYRDMFIDARTGLNMQVPDVLRFMIDKNVNVMSWLEFKAGTYRFVPDDDKISHCQIEIAASSEELLNQNHTVDLEVEYAPLRILSFDIETLIPLKGFPTGKQDSVIQIGSMVHIYGQDPEIPFIRTIFTVKDCSPIKGARVCSYENEADMLMAWRKFFLAVDADVIIGYNITRFDIPYLLDCAKRLGSDEFPYLGRIKTSPCISMVNDEKRRESYNCPDYDGRLILDLFPYFQENYPRRGAGGYTLNTISEHFLGQKKEDMHYTRIPVLHNGTADTRRELAVYCLKDVYLPLLLLAKEKCLESMVTKARATFIPFNAMRTTAFWKITARLYRSAIQA